MTFSSISSEARFARPIGRKFRFRLCSILGIFGGLQPALRMALEAHETASNGFLMPKTHKLPSLNFQAFSRASKVSMFDDSPFEIDVSTPVKRQSAATRTAYAEARALLLSILPLFDGGVKPTPVLTRLVKAQLEKFSPQQIRLSVRRYVAWMRKQGGTPYPMVALKGENLLKFASKKDTSREAWQNDYLFRVRGVFRQFGFSEHALDDIGFEVMQSVSAELANGGDGSLTESKLYCIVQYPNYSSGDINALRKCTRLAIAHALKYNKFVPYQKGNNTNG